MTRYVKHMGKIYFSTWLEITVRLRTSYSYYKYTIDKVRLKVISNFKNITSYQLYLLWRRKKPGKNFDSQRKFAYGHFLNYDTR